MKSLEFRDGQIYINGTRTLMKAGEFHYFRINRELWEPGLEKLKNAGMNVIASYVPWIWHEFEENKYDFVGKTDSRRDLLGFLDLVKKKGFAFMFRPGPYINAEYNGQGVPLWVGEHYPETIAKRPDGKLDGGPYWYTPTWNHPKYMELVKKWYATVFDAVSQYLGDPIVSVQLDNEIGVPYLNKIGVIDFNPVAISRFREWLIKKYNNIATLNAVWRTKYRSFEQILPPKKPVNPAAATDWQMFLDDEGIIFLTELKKIVRELNVNLPFSINEPSIVIAPMNSLKKAEFADIYGYDIYLKMSTEKVPFDMTFGDSIMPAMFLAIKKKEHPLASLEFGAGWFNPRTYQHKCYFAQTLIDSLAHGMKGMVLYVAHDCVEATGHIYAYDSIVRHDGSLGYKYKQYMDIYGAIEKYREEFLDSSLITDGSGIVFYYGNQYMLPGEYTKSGQLNPNKFRLKFGWAGLLAAEYLSGYRPEFVAIEKEMDLSKYPVLFFPSLGFVAPDIYKKLLNYVQNGGTLVTSPIVPRFDLYGNPLDTHDLFPAELVKEQIIGGMRIYLSIVKKMISYGIKGTIRKTIK
ncbi:MAG: beta-galactosidase [Candidatus Korarchaeota archaeon]